jgi:hypothetical protein
MQKLKTPRFPQRGGCLCGAVRYELSALQLAVYSCHCKDCQRMSVSTHTISMLVRRADVTLLCGDFAIYEKTADSGRTVRRLRCANCGTPVWNEASAEAPMLIMKAGNLDDMAWAQPVGNVWTRSRMPWVEIDESLPHYEKQPAERDALIAAWQAAHN